MNLYDLVMNTPVKMTKKEFGEKIRSDDEEEVKEALAALADGYEELLDD